MAMETQLDSIESVPDSGCAPGSPVMEHHEWLVIDSGRQAGANSSACQDPPPKKAKLMIQKDCSRDAIRWVPTSTGLVPFVKNADTQIVHTGRCQMKVVPCGAVSIVQCLSGCESELGCGGEGAGCTCLCHLLKAYYHEKHAL